MMGNESIEDIKPAVGEDKLASSSVACGMCTGCSTDPRLLSCLHSFCCECLASLDQVVVSAAANCNSSFSGDHSHTPGKSRQAVLCPTCGTSTEVPKLGVGALPVNYVLRNRNALLRGGTARHVVVVACSLCGGENAVTFRCIDCALGLCKLCKEAHARHRATADHAVVGTLDVRLQGAPLADRDVDACTDESPPAAATTSHEAHLRGTLPADPALDVHHQGSPPAGAAPRGVLHCERHTDEEVVIFCETCDRPACATCRARDHADHRCSIAADVAARHAKVIANLLRATQPHVDAVGGALSRVAATRAALEGRLADTAARAHAFVDAQVRALEQHRSELLADVESARRAKDTPLRLQQAQLSQLLEDLAHSCRVTEEALAEASPEELLSLKRPLVRRLRELNRCKYRQEPEQNDYVSFLPRGNEEAAANCLMRGRITTQRLCPAKCILKGEGNLNNARAGGKVELLLICMDVDGKLYAHGGDAMKGVLLPKQADSSHGQVNVHVNDRKDGTYHLEFATEHAGQYSLLLTIDQYHIQGSPFGVIVKPKQVKHTGLWHCCTFCSSGGRKEATCACLGSMPGGYRGCGHGHPGHPGRKHWSCCGKTSEHSSCTRHKLHGLHKAMPHLSPTSVYRQVTV
ncbi:PREDICTED: tripartite motif-containing protein 45-like [Priapulus caudatus]|uniref:Tripartite motif-containing protein 45-like n=1 Tax=Priapulus caudatus TaxID=37621 RepID=A0ABM1F9S3_PRICU|nr:PREDICTED: tripartite motif-containing protein 45-like [Priapulus caudatus]